MTEAKVTMKVVCGCGQSFEAHREKSSGAVMFPGEAILHAENAGHTMEIRGEVRVEKGAFHGNVNPSKR